MGSCVSRPVRKRHHRHQPKPSAVGPPPPLKRQESIPSALPHSGSKDEPFFDSQPWLESDCDDDFYSADGDYTTRRNSFVATRLSTGTPLTPIMSHGNTGVKTSSTHSRTSTPLHVNTGTPQSSIVGAEKQQGGYTPEISPTEKRKKLSELFRLSRGGGGLADGIIIINDSMPVDTKTVSGSVFTSVPSSSFVSDATSVCNSRRTSNVSTKSHRSKAQKSVYPIGCLNKLFTVRHKHEKGMDARSIKRRGEGNMVEV